LVDKPSCPKHGVRFMRRISGGKYTELYECHQYNHRFGTCDYAERVFNISIRTGIEEKAI
jgi:hypothetical protein